MAYYPPYIDETGLHMPTYEDRLADLCESFRAIYGRETVLSESVPDYQLLSVFARSMDDTSARVLNVLHQLNPQYASGQALDLMLPQYGLSRLPGETDASVRSDILTALAGNGRSMAQNILAEIFKVPNVRRAVVHDNDTDSTDERGIPAHSICAVVQSGSLQKIGEAIFRKKAPGIGTYGTTSKQVVDENGTSHTVYIYRPRSNYITFSITVKPLDGLEDSTLFAVSNGIVRYLSQFRIGQSLVVPTLYGVCYAAAGGKANTFAITDLAATSPLVGGTTRIRVPATWCDIEDADIELIRFNLNEGASGQWFRFNEQGERVYIPAY